jgi:hypothetical protein
LRRILIIGLVSAAVFLGTAGTSQAATWPAKCHNFKCVNAHLNTLHKQVKNVQGFLNCFTVAPATEYGDFLLDDGVTSTTGLDFTGTGDTIDFWLLGINPGTCGLPTTAVQVKSLPFGLRSPLYGMSKH